MYNPLTITGHNHRENLIWLTVFGVLLLATGLGLRDPWPADEPRFALIAKQMVDSGQWFFPMRGGELYPDKPPVFMWSIAAFYALTGSITVAFLLPSLLAGFGTLALVYDIARRLWSPVTAFRASAILLFTVQFTLQAKTAQIDALVCFWITLGCYALLRFLILEQGWRWYGLAGAAMGVGVITKGVGFLPLLMLIPFAIVRMRIRRETNQPMQWSWRWVIAPLSMLLAIATWFVPMLVLVDAYNDPLFTAYRDNILFKQTVTRYADSWHHIKPFWYYVVSVIPVFWLPLSVAIPFALKHWRQAWADNDLRTLLPLGFTLLLVVFFSLSPGKRGVYVLPALPMLTLALAPFYEEITASRWFRRLLWSLCVVLALVLLVLGLGGLFDAAFAIKLAAKHDISPWAMLTTVGGLGLVAALYTRKRLPLATWPMVISILWLIYSTWGYMLLGAVKTPKPVFQQLSEMLPDTRAIGLVNFSEQFILFSPHPVTHFGYHTPEQQQWRAAWQWLQNDHQVIIASDETAPECFSLNNAVDLGFAHRAHWYALGLTAKSANCDIPDDSVHIYTSNP
ncbi:glycosyltransferase family 39 protein [Aestuariibacter halophilus]|uniref:Glycosyltransferase family 39 protein n=1 Tax=Fluctibacter halophilus TaxID=226011 RepID=A0ABS8GAF8_9ALTE|nr:glycosyltransferase family 39 protein [Aestuariibacter halophilus]MCC2617076.1 glycosyltransferase family 39 protein [Aestuariibacter halophilus]